MDNQNQPQFTLRPLPQAELESFNTALQAFLDEKEVHLEARARISDQGTITSGLMVFKKVQLIPKEDGTMVSAEVKEDGSKTNEKSPEETDK